MKVLIIDTNILCVYLKVPYMNDAGPADDKWNYERVSSKIAEEITNKTILVLPMATLIETGNHIAQANGEIYTIAQDLANIIKKQLTKKNHGQHLHFSQSFGMKKTCLNWQMNGQG